MKCSFCGADVPERSEKCPVCGTPVNAEEGAAGEGSASQMYENPNGDASAEQSGSGNTGYSYGQPNAEQGGYSYGQPNGGQGGYGYGQPNGGQSSYNYGQQNYNGQTYGQPQKPISGTPYIVFSILATILCCLPFGVVGIVYASKINALQKMGDYEGAKAAAKKAKIWTIVSAVIGLVVSIIAAVGFIAADDYVSDLNSTNTVYEESDLDRETDDADDEQKKPAAPAEQSSELGSDWSSRTVQINETVLTLPCTVADFEKTGLKLNTEDTPEDYVINADDYEWIYFADANENNFMVTASNLTDSSKSVRECLITGIYVADWEVEDGTTTIIFPGGVKIGSSIDDAVAVNGEPDNISNNDEGSSYMWQGEGDDWSYFSVQTDKDKKIINMDLDIEDK